LKVRWTQDALAQLRAIQDWLAEIDGANPKRVTNAIKASVHKLTILGDIGRPSASCVKPEARVAQLFGPRLTNVAAQVIAFLQKVVQI
jgi:plasmid stabilization system protein ParE